VGTPFALRLVTGPVADFSPKLLESTLVKVYKTKDFNSVWNDTYEKQAVRAGALLLTRHPMKSVCPACPELLGSDHREAFAAFRPGRKGPLFTRRHKPREPRLLVHRHGLRGARRIANSVISATGAAVLVRYCDEFQPQSAAGNHMLHDCLDPDLSFRNKKIKLDSRARRRGLVVERNKPPRSGRRCEKHLPVHRIASRPTRRHVFRLENLSSGIERSYTRGCHSSLGPCGIERVVKRTTHGSKGHGRP